MTEGQNEFKKPRKPKPISPPEVTKGLQNFFFFCENILFLITV